VDSESPGAPNGVDAYRHFFYNGGWQVLEERVSAAENTEPETLQPEYQYPPSWRGHYGVAGVWSVRYTRHGGQVDAAVREYIRNQEAHHRTMTFQDEFRALLRKHSIEFDERYVWE